MSNFSQFTTKVKGGTTFLSPSSVFVSVDTTREQAVIVLPSIESMNEFVNRSSGNYHSTTVFTIYDELGTSEINSIKIITADGSLINGQQSIFIINPFGSIIATYNGNGYNAQLSETSPTTLSFFITKDAMENRMTKNAPLVLLSNKNAEAYIDIEDAGLLVLDGNSSYNGSSIKIGYVDSKGVLLDFVKDITIEKTNMLQSNQKVQHVLQFNVDKNAPLTRSMYRAKNEIYSNLYSPATLEGASLVAYMDTPPSGGKGIAGCMKLKIGYGIPVQKGGIRP